MKLAAVLLALTVLGALAHAQSAGERPIKFARFPALSPDGSQLAFSYQGNLWSVSSQGGVATRLTANDSFDTNPQWSPDGNWIAFNSDREGGNQVFVIPSQGGAARQITNFSPGATVCGWYPDGRRLLVISNRGEMRSSLYALELDTGRFTLIYTDRVAPQWATLSPDGRTVAFSRGSLPDTYRKGYVGAANHDIYLAPAALGDPARVLWRDPDRVNQLWPAWARDGKSILFAHDLGRDGWVLARRTLDGKHEILIPKARDAIRYVAAARKADNVVFDALNQLYAWDPSSRQSRKLEIYCRTDERGVRQAPATFAGSGVQEFALSPDGKRTAIVIRGDLFVFNNERGGEAKRLTATAERESNPVWAKDGKALVFAAVREGRQRLAVVQLATGEIRYLTEPGAQESHAAAPQFSPSGQWIAYIHSPRASLRLVKPDGSQDHEVVAGPGIDSFDWSPDGRWLAYSRSAGYWDSDLFLVRVDDSGKVGVTVSLSNHPGENIRPKFFLNGEKIAFLSNRYRNRDIETINHSGRFTIYATPLAKEKETFDFDEDVEAPPAKPDPKKPVEVKVDADEIDRRARLVFPFFEGVQEFAVHPDGQSMVFTASSLGVNDFYQIAADGGNLQRLTTGGEAGSRLVWSPDGSRLYFLRGDEIRWMGKGGQGRGSLSFTARMEIERKEDYYAVFDEAWATMAATFYDPNFHGADWPAMRAKYRPLIEDVSIRQDFNLLVNQMLGELNASHLGFSGGLSARPARQTGALGIQSDSLHRGQGVKVKSVLARSPASKSESLLLPGQIVLEVDGKPVYDGLSFDTALLDKVGRTVTLTVNTVVSTANAQKIKIKPISYGALASLVYEAWIDSRRALVDKTSNGRLGYLHVPDMGDAARNRFERELFALGRTKDGVVLDFRFNNGGDTHDSLLQFLDRRVQYLTFTPRGEDSYRQPERIFAKPTILVVDEFSLSDAEVFTMGYKTLRIGKVVGRPTMGWIIFTSGRQLVDGSFIRTPYIGTYASDGRNMENWGVPPDIEVFFEPEHAAAGTDPQLERAVRELLAGR